ncbi:TniQ family protein (plasmid) [Pseudomonas sp. BYT-1]|nr:TniQ family protein [Pseudomonas sp. BYT-1]
MFSSWLCRLAWGNGTKLQAFTTHHLLQSAQFLSQDIDRVAADSLLNSVARRCGVSAERAHQSCLSAYAGVLWERFNPRGPLDWALLYRKGAHNPRQRQGYALQFCRLCLAEDEDPYFRRGWRLAFSTTCTRHGIYLSDACPLCHSPVVPTLSDRGKRLLPLQSPLAYCYQCHWDLRLPVTGDLPADARELDFQQRLLTALVDGCALDLPGASNYSLLMFRGLKRLLQLLGGGGRFRRVREQLLDRLQCLDLQCPVQCHYCFEAMRVGDRSLELELLRTLLECWPEFFVNACLTAKVSSSYIQNYRSTLPFWLYRPVDQFLFDQCYAPSMCERTEARKYLVARGQPANDSAVNRLLGVWSGKAEEWRLQAPRWNTRSKRL